MSNSAVQCGAWTNRGSELKRPMHDAVQEHSRNTTWLNGVVSDAGHWV